MNEPATPAEWPKPDAGTGDPEVEAALADLGGLSGLPVSGHAGVYESVHDALREALDRKDGTGQ